MSEEQPGGLGRGDETVTGSGSRGTGGFGPGEAAGAEDLDAAALARLADDGGRVVDEAEVDPTFGERADFTESETYRLDPQRDAIEIGEKIERGTW